jgi:hypothetical protein
MPKLDLSSRLHHPRNGLPTIAGRPPAACQSLMARGHEPGRGEAEGRRSRTSAMREHPATPLFAPHHDFRDNLATDISERRTELARRQGSIPASDGDITDSPATWTARALHSVDGLGRAGYGAGSPSSAATRPNVGGNTTRASDMPRGWCRAKLRFYCLPTNTYCTQEVWLEQ